MLHPFKWSASKTPVPKPAFDKKWVVVDDFFDQLRTGLVILAILAIIGFLLWCSTL